ncbi:helix-turn-helix transcriptional regulator [Cellulomonas sp.]|uniref:helix-turn-helix transcriptional regulator n=1 Tax=Cellulomonas sp. TaxID=40001 RepID=UPI003BAAF323
MDRTELAQVLTRARTALTPQDVGLPAGSRRRVAGLRREEVAQLAGVSVDYVVRLEQGRGPHPSAQVLSALARALRMDDDARAELFHLAGSAPPMPGTVDEHVRPSVQRLLDRLDDLPTMVLSARGDILAWNSLASALLGDWSLIPRRERNIIWQRFLGTPDPRRSTVAMDDDERRATDAQAVATLRATTARYPRDPAVQELVSELRRRSERFDELWRAGGSSTSWPFDRKAIDHPSLGRITLDCDSLHVPSSDQTVIVYSAEPGTPDSDALALLRVLGTQSMTTAG